MKRLIAIVFLTVFGAVNLAFSQTTQIAGTEKTNEKQYTEKTPNAEPNAAREKTKRERSLKQLEEKSNKA